MSARSAKRIVRAIENGEAIGLEEQRWLAEVLKHSWRMRDDVSKKLDKIYEILEEEA